MKLKKILKKIEKIEKNKNIFLIIPLILIGLIISEIISLNSMTYPEIINNPVKTIEIEKTNAQNQVHRVPILMYHHVRDYDIKTDPTGIELSISPTQFEEQINIIKDNNFNFITMSDFSKNNFSQKDIVLTFDDGYDNFYYNVFPLIQKYKIKATVYIITGKIGQSGYLTQSNIDELTNSGLVEIGAHAVSHIDLTKYNLETTRSQIINSKLDSESFCYPSGKYNNEVINLVKEAGYKNATTTNYGIAQSSDNPFEIPRIRVKSSTNIVNILKQI